MNNFFPLLNLQEETKTKEMFHWRFCLCSWSKTEAQMSAGLHLAGTFYFCTETSVMKIWSAVRECSLSLSALCLKIWSGQTLVHLLSSSLCLVYEALSHLSSSFSPQIHLQLNPVHTGNLEHFWIHLPVTGMDLWYSVRVRVVMGLVRSDCTKWGHF